MDKLSLSFDDVLLKPQFSLVKSRKDVDTSVELCGVKLETAIISSNMDSVTSFRMANAMRENGAIGALHRFNTIDDNVTVYKSSHPDTFCSVGLGVKEAERAEALVKAGCQRLIIDVANGASMEVVNQLKLLRDLFKDNVAIMVGNFATGDAVSAFLHYAGDANVDSVKVGIGGGSACLTRVVTGCGASTLGSILDIRSWMGSDFSIVADGGIKNSGDYCKALAAGAHAVMLGGLLASCDESPGEVIDETEYSPIKLIGLGKDKHLSSKYQIKSYKKYRGSASSESYEVQGKTASHRSYEGDSFLVPYTGPVSDTLTQFQGGLRSCMSYNNATTVYELQENAEFIEISSNGAVESKAHGKNRT